MTNIILAAILGGFSIGVTVTYIVMQASEKRQRWEDEERLRKITRKGSHWQA